MRVRLTRSKLLTWAAALVSACYATAAFAIGDDVTIGSFSCSNGTANGQLLVSGTSCPTSLQITNVFSFLICNIEQLAGNILGHMYCGMIYELAPAVWALATLAVVVFGISFTIGLIATTGREALMFLLKIAFVTAFATNAELIVSYGYSFLVGGIKEGIEIALGGMNVAGATTGTDAYKMLDGFLYQIFKTATDAVGKVAAADRCQNAVFAVIATMAAIFPIFAYLALLLVGRVLLTFFRATFGYIYAIVGITFLLILSPFFVPMYLFKQTQPYFNKWIGYMASFVMQMILLFAFIAFILSLGPKTKNMVSNLTNIIMYQEQTLETTSFRFPWEYCTLCDFEAVDKTSGTPMKWDDKELISKAKLQCKVTNPANVKGAPGFDSTKPITTPEGYRPIEITLAIAPPDPTKPTTSDQMNGLISLAGTGIVSLIILAAVVSQILTLLPTLAVRLASGLGAAYAPQLGGGANPNVQHGFSTRFPGESLVDQFSTGFKQSAEQRSYTWDRPQKNKTIDLKGNRVTNVPVDGNRSSADAIRDSARGLVTGRGINNAPIYTEKNSPGASQDDLNTKNANAGIQQAWRRFLGGL